MKKLLLLCLLFVGCSYEHPDKICIEGHSYFVWERYPYSMSVAPRLDDSGKPIQCVAKSEKEGF